MSLESTTSMRGRPSPTGIVSVPDAPEQTGVNGLLAFGVAAVATMALASRSRG
ncbi:MAG TPA: hypothetical protein VEX37_10890 [Thermomicrobiales bacterium]|nr:hypothetical protein [Thermomicrobiales bacterium]